MLLVDICLNIGLVIIETPDEIQSHGCKLISIHHFFNICHRINKYSYHNLSAILQNFFNGCMLNQSIKKHYKPNQRQKQISACVCSTFFWSIQKDGENTPRKKRTTS